MIVPHPTSHLFGDCCTATAAFPHHTTMSELRAFCYTAMLACARTGNIVVLEVRPLCSHILCASCCATHTFRWSHSRVLSQEAAYCDTQARVPCPQESPSHRSQTGCAPCAGRQRGRPSSPHHERQRPPLHLDPPRDVQVRRSLPLRIARSVCRAPMCRLRLSSHYSRMFSMKTAAGVPLFETMQISLICQDCLAGDHPERYGVAQHQPLRSLYNLCDCTQVHAQASRVRWFYASNAFAALMVVPLQLSMAHSDGPSAISFGTRSRWPRIASSMLMCACCRRMPRWLSSAKLEVIKGFARVPNAPSARACPALTTGMLPLDAALLADDPALLMRACARFAPCIPSCAMACKARCALPIVHR